jgi:hypothetical protein
MEVLLLLLSMYNRVVFQTAKVWGLYSMSGQRIPNYIACQLMGVVSGIYSLLIGAYRKKLARTCRSIKDRLRSN